MVDEITTRDATKTFLRQTGQLHGFQLRTFTFHVLELEDLHFNHDSAVLLPDFQNPPTDDGSPQPRITSLAILATCLQESTANSTRKLIFCAHADTSGGTAYNVKLTEKRGHNAVAVLLGDADAWVEVAKAQHKVEDIQMILTWIARDWGWGCDPGGVDNDFGPRTRQGVTNFQVQYNQLHEAGLPENGTVEDKTWHAFFQLYQEELLEVADTDAAGLAQLRAGLRWVDDARRSVGCGESFPIDHPTRRSYRSASNRRVEICFFDDGETPLLDCHPAAGTCKPRSCEIYNLRAYVPAFIPVSPILPRVVRVRVHLELRWKDPTGREHPFPKDTPIKLAYPDGTTEDQQVADGGRLTFIADRRKTRFTLQYEQETAQYVGSGPDDKEEILAEPDADAKARDQGYRIWKLPKRWSLGETMWAVTSDHWADPHFRLDTSAIGTAAAPVAMVLDPTWQHVRFECFDRHFGHSDHGNTRIAPPPLTLEGLNEDPGDIGQEKDDEADTRSNWTRDDADREAMCQALPWLLQRAANGSADPAAKPDENILLRFKTEPGTFVFAESATVRRLQQPAAAQLAPGPERLKYYDLPELWMSPGFWIRLPGTADAGKFWRDLTRGDVRASLQPESVLRISLDDIVLYDGAGTTPLQADQRPAVIYHSFDNTTPGASDFTLSRYGVYKPGSYDGTQHYYPYSDITLDPVRYYIRDYPNWVRLVVAQGNLYDVFSERTARDAMGTPAGARAARRWVDAVATTVVPGNTLNPRPGRTDQLAFSMQPFYRTEKSAIRTRDTPAGKFEEWNNPYPSVPTWGDGRFDLALLRCCSAENGREQAVNLHYFRFFFDYSTPPAALNTAAARASYTRSAVDNIVKRWNGPDGTYNPDPAILKPQDPVAHRLEVKPVWFVQELPVAEAHFRISVTSIPRAFMQPSDGTGQYSADSHQPMTAPPHLVGWFTAAHECGHADGLPDDYGEAWNGRACSYGLPSFTHNITADAYSLISANLAMMFRNRELHPRYFWHAAEWVRAATGIPMQVEQGATRKFRMPQHPRAPGRHYVTWPVWREVGITGIGTGGRGRFDMYVYHLGDKAAGDDPYRDRLVPGHTFDALALILVKMRVTLPAAAQADDIKIPMQRALRGIEDNFNLKFQCSGDLGPFHFDNCLIHFSPRFLIDTPTPDWDFYLKGLDFTPAFPTTTPPFPNAAARTAYFNNTVVPGYAAKVARIDSAASYPRHFMVTADNTGATSWSGGTSLHYRIPGNPADDYWQYFGDMLGLGLSSGGALTSAQVSALFVSRFMANIGMSNV